MPKINPSTAFSTAASIDPEDILDTLYHASRDGILELEDVPYDGEMVVYYRTHMNKLWGRDDYAVAVCNATTDKIQENAHLADDCKLHSAHIAKLEKIGAPSVVIENERLLLTVLRFINAYTDKVEAANVRGEL